MKRFFKIAAVLLVVLIAALLALPFLIDVNRFRPLLEQQLTQVLHRDVRIGNLSLALLQGGVSATELSIAEDPAFGTKPFLTAKTLNVGVDMKRLILERALHVESVTIDGADVALIQDAAAKWNFSSLAASNAPAPPQTAAAAPAPVDATEQGMDLSVKNVRIANSRVTVTDPGATHAFTDVAFELRDFAKDAALPFTLSAATGGGTVKLDGTAGPLNETDSAESPFNTKIEIKDLDLAASGFADPSSGMAGVLTFNGDANSNGKVLAAKGAATIDKLKVSRTGAVATRPVAANIALTHDLKAQRGNIATSTLKLGSASANISGSYNLAGKSPAIDTAVKGPGMPLQELIAFLPVFGVVLPTGATIEGGTLSLDVASRGTTTNLATAGSVKIQNAKLTNYDLGEKLKIIQQLAGISATSSTNIDLMAASFTETDAGTIIKDIRFLAPSIGELTGEGTVSPSKALDFRMKAVVKTGGVLAAAIRQRGETTTVPFFILGTAQNPVFKADLKSVANEKIQQAIKNPEGAVKNAKEIVNTARDILDMFKKAPPKAPEQK